MRLLLLSFLLLTSPLAAAERIAIYYPTTHEVRDIQKTLGGDPALSGITANAFARFEDFTFSLGSDPYEFAILPSVLPRYLPEFEPVFQFTLGSAKSFKYSIISIDSKWDKSKLATGVGGMVDEVGRKNIKLYVESLMAGQKFKRIKQVGKVIDLFPMLSLGNVDYIVISPRDLEHLKKEFTTRTYKVVDTIEVDYPVLCIKNGYDKKKAQKFERISKATLSALGFDGIVEIEK
ncbi:MAG: hypothetical protein M3Q07_26025 [Pseudobdellovibrionaceae bacterium]|nr:hypothetical protein [Pseudobdellovibrionaceae bacterium]